MTNSIRIRTQDGWTLSTVTTDGRVVLSDNWDLEFTTQLGEDIQGGFLKTIRATHQFDCTFIALQYRAQDDFISIYWGVTAFPKGHLGWSSNEDAFGPGILDNWSGSGGGFSGGGGMGFDFGGGYSGGSGSYYGY